MAIDSYIEQIFPIKCKGRNERGEEVLKTPIDVKLKVYQANSDERGISSLVECPFITGSHGQRCKLFYPESDRIGKGIKCPYSFDIPYALEIKK